MVSARRGLGNRVFVENQAQQSAFLPDATRLHEQSVRPLSVNTTRIVASSLVEFWHLTLRFRAGLIGNLRCIISNLQAESSVRIGHERPECMPARSVFPLIEAIVD